MHFFLFCFFAQRGCHPNRTSCHPRPDTRFPYQPPPQASRACPILPPHPQLSPAFWCKGQLIRKYLPCQMTPQVVHSQPAFSFPTAPPQPKKSLPVVPLPEGATLHAVGMLNGEVLYAAVDASQPAPAPLPPATCARSSSRKRKRKRRRKSAAAKKPPDAFMCFLRERRSASKSPSEQKDGVAVNKRLAQLWTSLSKEQRAKYYQQAYVEKKLREQMSSDSGSGDDDEDDRVACPRSCREGLSDGLTCAPGPEKKRRRCDAERLLSAAKHQGGDACNTGDDAPASSCSSLGSSSSSSSSSSSLSSWLEAVIAAEGAESPAAPRPASPAPNKCPDSGDESDIEGMDAKLLHLLGCC
ncbi:transcription factor 7-like 1-A isoform X3 [Hippocampus zosterae]|uniref:transcription factor 7-like 1-A isoform X3 n=1 Tax=Hippocampus zosterae TaxID=109293 RepID=UPI00223CC094|nr:transcription factor 7-like 1-A isoform X3 [Hippocampus zosterae]